MRHVYMLDPETEHLDGNIAAHVYTRSLARARAAGGMKLQIAVASIVGTVELTL